MEKRRLRVTDGGYAVPLGNNYFLMKGKTHEQGGIGLSDKIEVENNEIVKVNKDSAKVYSAQPMIAGYSPAELILRGASPRKVFSIQQSINGNNNDGYGKEGTDFSILSGIKRFGNKLEELGTTIANNLYDMYKQMRYGENDKVRGIDGNIYNNEEERQQVVNDLNKEQIETYNVKKGDSLWKIANENGITVNELRRLNPNIKKDIIYPNQTIITNRTNNKLQNIEDAREKEESLNKTNLGAIQGAKHDSNYAVIDKANKVLNVYDKDNNLIYSTNEISTGSSGNDYLTLTYHNLRKPGNMSTPAGITKITSVGNYHGSPSFQRSIQTGDSWMAIPSSMHYGNTSNKYNSNGCVRLSESAAKQLSNFIGKDTMVYTLPTDDKSRFTLKDGKLSFVADNPYGNNDKNNPKKYWDDYATHRDTSYNPLYIENKSKQTDSIAFENENKYINSITTNKERLQKELHMDSDTYNRIAKLAMGIAQQESEFGSGLKYALKNVNNGALVDTMKAIKMDNSANSRGMTQIKISSDNKELQALYKKYGIDYNTIVDPEKAAIATMLRLGYMYSTEVVGRKFKTADGKGDVTDEEALLYKWQGKNRTLKTDATPDKNIYIQRVKKFADNYNYYTKQQYKYGGIMKNKNNDKEFHLVKDTFDAMFPSTGERKKFLTGGQMLGINAGLQAFNALAQGIAGSVNASNIEKMYNSMKRKSTYVPIARRHINTNYDVSPMLDANRDAEFTLAKNAMANTSSSKVAREQLKQARLARLSGDTTAYSTKINEENKLKAAETELQKQYDIYDNQSLTKDISDSNDFEMQKQLGISNAKTSAANTWGQSIGTMLSGVGNTLLQYTAGNYDLLKSQNPAAVAQGMENLYGHAFKYDETAKSYVLKDAYKNNPKYQQIAATYNNYMTYASNPANIPPVVTPK